jgi:hypothetical protein
VKLICFICKKPGPCKQAGFFVGCLQRQQDLKEKQFKTNRYEKHIKTHAMAKTGHAPVKPLVLVYRDKSY